MVKQCVVEKLQTKTTGGQMDLMGWKKTVDGGWQKQMDLNVTDMC